ncbi:AI-2E family transporter [Nocardioides caldifontis]|uniref:AI-2E family transporter n=1 Tax=Nocardioides caldifontis TaxID=2588938 RepID=UPI001EF0842B|nr:AI-2E family transporter [Nocardioides caldifontis]
MRPAEDGPPPDETRSEGAGAPCEGGRLHGVLSRRRRRAMSQEQLDDQFERRFSAQFAKHWAQVRAERRHDEADPEEPSIRAGQSNFRTARVPYGVDLAAAWSWRFLVIVAAGAVIAYAVSFFSLVMMPVVVALFVAALVAPLVNLLALAFGRGLSSLLVVVLVLGVVGLMLTFATQQVIQGANDLAEGVVEGLEEIRTWLRDGPFHVSDAQIDDGIQEMQDLVVSSNEEIVGRLQDVGTTITHIVAGFFIVLFATYFFLADGRTIWAWVVRLFPRAARERVDASGRVAWLSLTQFVRATVLVALVDAVGIMIVAAILKVPFVAAIGVLVFLGAFVPLVGATVSGFVACLVALVDQGPIVALIMLGGVIGVQQLEAHILQPFLLGRMVSVHPLAVILSIACGVYLAGIAGALVAVPFVAALNAVVVYLNQTPPEVEPGRTDPVVEAAEEDPAAG